MVDFFPLYNSLRVAAISTTATFFLGLWAACAIARAPRFLRGILDVVLTLPLVLPPTVVGFFLLKLLGPRGIIGSLANIKLAMTWYSAVFTAVVVAFPLMYRTARGAFASFDKTFIHAAQTLGLSNTYIFWRITMPNCRSGILAGTILAFARALGEYGATSMLAGYTPGRTATISTTVYQLWRIGDNSGAYGLVAVNIVISLVVLEALNLVERGNAPQS